MDRAWQHLKNLRDDRERFFLQGSKLCFLHSEKLQSENRQIGIQNPDKLDVVSRNTQLVDRLSQLSSPEYYADSEEPTAQIRPVYSNAQILNSMFCVYDITALFSEDLPEVTADKIKTIIHRINQSDDVIMAMSDLRSNPTGRIIGDDSIDIKVSNLELCLLNDKLKKDEVNAGLCDVEEDLLHELFISFLYTNRLRKIIPNFQLCYAGLKATKNNQTTNEEENEMTTNCVGLCPYNTTQTIDYLIQEKLDGVTMTMALRTCTLTEYLSWMVQILFSLELGVIHFGFTHNNLNPDNITITPIQPQNNPKGDNEKNKSKQTINIPYFHNNNLFIVKASSIAVITNFELAHVKHKYNVPANSNTPNNIPNSPIPDDELLIKNQSEHFGPIGFENLGIFHNETRPFYDIYKIVMWSLRILQKHNEAVFSNARKISKFFGFVYERKLNEALANEERLSYIYSTSISELERTRSIRDLFKLMIKEFPEMKTIVESVSSYNKVSVLKCDGFCPVSGFVSSDFTNGNKNSDTNSLRLFSLQDILERYHGLNKRVEELTRLSYGFCKVSDTMNNSNKEEIEEDRKRVMLCQPSTDELIEATREFKDYVKLIQINGIAIFNKAAADIDVLIKDINDRIRLNNIDVANRKQYEKQINDRPKPILSKEYVQRKQEEITGKITILANRLSYLNKFGEQFSIIDGPVTTTIDVMDTF